MTICRRAIKRSCWCKQERYHVANACYGRDFMPTKTYDISKVKDGDKCIDGD